MKSEMTDLIKRLREADSYNKKYYALDPLHKEAADRIDELVEINKELTLQLLAVHGQAADLLDKAVVAEAKLTKAVELLKTMGDYNKYVVAPFLAELEGKK